MLLYLLLLLLLLLLAGDCKCGYVSLVLQQRMLVGVWLSHAAAGDPRYSPLLQERERNFMKDRGEGKKRVRRATLVTTCTNTAPIKSCLLINFVHTGAGV